jgi:hypothetical protein
MTYWTIIILMLAFYGVVLNIIVGSRMDLILQDIILLLVALGMLIRIRYMTNKGDKEKLEKKLTE